MAGRPLMRAATAPVSSQSVLTPPPEAYAPNPDSAERALAIPLLAMQPQESEMRYRQHQRSTTSTTGELGSSTESDTLTPTLSIEGEPQVRTWPSAQTGWLRFLGNLRQRPYVQPSTTPREPVCDRGYHRIKHGQLADHEQGIPRFAAFQASNDSFCMFRRFENESIRILNIKQVELQQLATKLHELDKKDAADKTMNYRLSSIEYHDKWDSTQKDLLEDIEKKLTVYHESLDRYNRIASLESVKPRHHRSVYDFNINNRSFDGGEDAFLFKIDDFAYGRKKSEATTQQGSRIEDMIESYLQNNPESRLHGLFVGHDERNRSGEGFHVVHLSTFRLGLAPKIAAAVLGAGALLTPIFLLYLGDIGRGRMSCVVGVFVLVFLATISVVIDVTPHDIFIFIVGYSAVLVTLLSNFNESK